jgi:hypothetical protein
MELSPSWWAASCATAQEFPNILRNPKDNRHFHKSPPLVPILSQISTDNTTPCYLSIIIFFIISGVRLSPLGTAATSGLLYQPQMLDEGDCGEIGGMKIGRGNRHFVHHKSHMSRPGLEPGPPRWEASD